MAQSVKCLHLKHGDPDMIPTWVMIPLKLLCEVMRTYKPRDVLARHSNLIGVL